MQTHSYLHFHSSLTTAKTKLHFLKTFSLIFLFIINLIVLVKEKRYLDFIWNKIYSF